MKHNMIRTPLGEELVMMPLADFNAMQQQLELFEHHKALADYAAGRVEAITSEEMIELLDAPTPLAFWRKKRGLTQIQLAHKVSRSQSYIADLEQGRRKGDPSLFKKLAEALRVPMEDLVAD